MNDMIKVYSSQFNYQYGNNIHFPYSIGTLVTYLKSKESIKSKFEFKKTAVFREHVYEYIKKLLTVTLIIEIIKR